MSAAVPAHATMKAIVQHGYGSPDVLELKEVARPTVDDDSVLVRVRAASLNAADWHLLRGQPYVARLMMGLRRPKRTVPGIDLAGHVETVGTNVTQFKPGDEVFGARSGACAEYVLARERNLVSKPSGLTFEQAAAIPTAAVTALQGFRDVGQIQPGQKVLINGAAGGVGTFAVQIAKSFGADVTAVCSTRNVDMVRSLGADRVIDYTKEDFTRSGQRYDLIFDNAANRSRSDLRRVLAPNGTVVPVGAPKGTLVLLLTVIQMLVLSRFMSRRRGPFLARHNKEDLLVLRDLAETGKITSVIDRRYTLREVPEAMRYLGEGHARGKIVITI